ncbi:hypothetical protein NDU88_006010, partial [Pleurodeles waltl]
GRESPLPCDRSSTCALPSISKRRGEGAAYHSTAAGIIASSVAPTTMSVAGLKKQFHKATQ